MLNESIWLDIDKLAPHPKNPRIGRPDKIDVIKASMLVDGYLPEKPMLVRPHGDGYQIIGGHSRFTAAKEAGLDRVLCVVKEMDDEQAILRMGSDNINDPLPWYSVCLYVVQNSQKDSKKGLSRAALIRAATGKEGEAAKQDAKWKALAGEVLNYLMEQKEQSVHVDTLLDDEQNKTRHLSAIHALPESCWPVAVETMLAKGWSAKDTAERIRASNEFSVPDDYAAIYPIADVISRHFSGDFSPQSFKKIIAQCRRVEDLIVVHANGDDVSEMVDVFRGWLRQERPFAVAPIAAYERQLAAEFKKSEKSAEEFKLGNWRDHIGGLTDGSVSLLLTDPPYGMDYQSNRRAERNDRIANDGVDEAANEIRECLQAMHPKLAKNSHLLVFTGWRHEPDIRRVIEDAGYQIRGSLVWKKNNHGSGDLRGSFAPMHERIIHAVKGNPALVSRIPDVIDADKVATDRHPTEKPIDLLNALIEATTVEGELVADPFAGVASTLVSAKKKSRAFWGCELSEKYHQAGVSRL